MSDSYEDLGTVTDKWMRRPDWSSPVAQNFDTNLLETLSYTGTSIEVYNKASVFPPIVMKYKYVNNSKSDEYELINFITTVQGRLKKFWIPTWQSPFNLALDINLGDMSCRVSNNNYGLVVTQEHRLLFVLRNGDFISRKVTVSVELDDEEELLTVDTAFDRDIQIDDVELICYFLLVRFNSDTFQIRYITDIDSEITFDVYELIKEYP